jgi:site-specific DNA-methyltransferase (adenine-specific)
VRPYYQDDFITLYHADNRDVLPTLSGVGMVFTSPPYNLGGQPWPHLGNWKQGDSADGKSKWRNGSDGAAGVSYSGHKDNLPHAEYVAWQRETLTLCWKSLADDGAIFYNHKPRVIGARAWLPLELNPDLPLRQIVIWARSGGMNFNPTAYVPTHEWLMIFAKSAWRLNDRAASGAGDVWKIPQESNPLHPAPFPVALPTRAIESASPALVLDPFAGIGSTLRAAKNLSTHAIGIEIDERYCETAAKLLSQEVLHFGDVA